MVVNAAMASVGLRPRRIAWRMRSWISVGLVIGGQLPHRRHAIAPGLEGFVPRHQVTQRHRSASWHFEPPGHPGNQPEAQTLCPWQQCHPVGETRCRSRASPCPAQTLRRGRGPGGIHLVFGVKQHQLASERMGAKATMASDCGGRGPAVFGPSNDHGRPGGGSHPSTLAGQRDGSHQRTG